MTLMRGKNETEFFRIDLALELAFDYYTKLPVVFLEKKTIFRRQNIFFLLIRRERTNSARTDLFYTMLNSIGET